MEKRREDITQIQLSKMIEERTGISNIAVNEVINHIKAIITEEVYYGTAVRLRGLGKFEMVLRKGGREVVHFGTERRQILKDFYKPKFTPSKNFGNVRELKKRRENE